MSVSAFCRRSKIPRGSFVKWKQRLSRTGEPGPGFVEWIGPNSVPEQAPSSGEFELSLPGGVVLRWKA